MPPVLRLLRPQQWVKNLLVFAAPLAAGESTHGSVIVRSLWCFAAWCLASSATYVINDLRDVEADRRHPAKSHRPIASGAVSGPAASMMAVLCIALAVICAVQTGWSVLGIIGGYVVLTTLYSLGLKRITVVEMIIVSSGFVLRGISGAAAGEVPVSSWFFVVLSAASIVVVAAKRSSELKAVGSESGTRHVLGTYTPEFLSSVQTLAMAVALIGYCLWAFESAVANAADPAASALFKISVAPFATALLRFLQIGEAGDAGAPETLITDRILLGCAVCWGGTYGLGILLKY